jgi:hypothetical protein
MSDTDIHGIVEPGDTAGLYAAFGTALAALDGDFNLATVQV